MLDEARKPKFTKANLVRVPLRLGIDVFATGKISKAREDMILNTMQAYRYLLNAYGVTHLKACATSAMRDASNSAAIIKKVAKATGIKIEIITGGDEAAYIQENHIAEKLSKDASYLYVDVGGGSTETTCYSKGKLVFQQSFNIGTIRLMKGMTTEGDWEEMKQTLKEKLHQVGKIIAIGSGGNINKINSMAKNKADQPLSFDQLKNFHQDLAPLSVPERMLKFGLREDRADVIVPALEIYLNVMRWSGARQIYVPQIGLADGLIQHLYYELKYTKQLPPL